MYPHGISQKIKRDVKDIMEKVKKMDLKEYRAMAAASQKKDTSSEKLQRTASKASKRQTAVEALNRLLRIEVVNASTIRLLSSPAYKTFMAERVMTKLVSKSSESIASNFNKVFFNSQFSRRAIANFYWGEDNRYHVV